MVIFTSKSKIMQERALIGTDGDIDGSIVWDEVDFEYAWSLFRSKVLEDRGYRVVNSIHYRLFYLPGPKDIA